MRLFLSEIYYMALKKIKERKERIKNSNLKRVRKLQVKEIKEEEPAAGVLFKELPLYQGRRVSRLLDEGHTKTHYHCRMEDGTTQHVPKERFK